MKKILLSVLTLALLLTGCKALKEDKVPATAEITTSTGDAYVVNSVNGAGYDMSGAARAVHYTNRVALELSDGETATVHFFCDACGYDTLETIEAPYAKLFACDCPEEIDSAGNAREYLSIAVGAVK